jgi:predicted GNAT superfamily acetyltransferase
MLFAPDGTRLRFSRFPRDAEVCMSHPAHPEAGEQRSPNAPTPVADRHDLTIRTLTSPDDYRACVALQREVWGATYDVVPAAIVQVARHVGGLAIGAFEPDGNLGGFVFGLTGIDDDGNTIHWSHMLGVRNHLRNAGVGRRLKEAQRRELERRRISRMYWTYDPLIAKNAHFNLNVLGAHVVRFAPNLYGDTGSPLHHGLPTDRLVVAFDTAAINGKGEQAHAYQATSADGIDSTTPLLTAERRADDPPQLSNDEVPHSMRLEIPLDFATLLARTPDSARRWHAATREHFQWALERGYVVVGLRRDGESDRAYYQLEQLQQHTS